MILHEDDWRGCLGVGCNGNAVTLMGMLLLVEEVATLGVGCVSGR